MTILEALKKLESLLYEDDDMMSQENLFEAQEIASTLVEHFENYQTIKNI